MVSTKIPLGGPMEKHPFNRLCANGPLGDACAAVVLVRSSSTSAAAAEGGVAVSALPDIVVSYPPEGLGEFWFPSKYFG